jgi:hypothetical protein
MIIKYLINAMKGGEEINVYKNAFMLLIIIIMDRLSLLN